MRQRRSTRILLGVLAGAIALVPGTASAAKPVEQFHDHFTDSFPGVDLCGITVDVVVVVTDNFFLYEDGSFKDVASVRQTFTNPDTGRSVIVASAGVIRGTAVVDEQAGTITFTDSFLGLPERIQTERGALLSRDAGVITFTDTFDLETGDLISSTVEFTGPHPEAEEDFELFCEVIVPALT